MNGQQNKAPEKSKGKSNKGPAKKKAPSAYKRECQAYANKPVRKHNKPRKGE